MTAEPTILWRGKPLEQLTRAELEQAFRETADTLDRVCRRLALTQQDGFHRKAAQRPADLKLDEGRPL